MNRPRRPPFQPARKKSGPPRPADGGPPRRRSPLDYVPATAEPRFQVLGTGQDRQALLTFATPTEMLIVHGYTRQIEEAYSKHSGRSEDFWTSQPDALAAARKVDEVLAGIVARRKTA